MKRNVKLAKRLISVLLCMALILGELPLMGQKALADEPVPAAAAHTHCVCGETSCSGEGHNKSQVWTEWTNGTSLPSTAGYYYLSKDVTLNATWEPANGTYLCLNGHVVKTTSGRVIEIDYDHSFTLTDCDITTTHRFTVNEDGLWVLDEINGSQTVTGGVITGGHADEAGMLSGCGGAILANGTFYMYGGNICGNAASTETNGSGGGICGETVYIYGGKIHHNVAKYSGGGISGTLLRLLGGEIFGNSALWGGGVNSSIVEVSGGTIWNNTAESGAGIMAQDGLFLIGGEITDNMASGHGGGIFVNDYTYTKISGKVTIADNSAGCTVTDGVYSGGVTENMYLPSGKTIAVNGELLTGSSIGITMESGTGTFAKPDGNVLTDISGLAEFFCSDEGYEIVADGANLAMQEKVVTHIHCVCGDAACDEMGHDASQAWVDWTDGTSLPAEAGYYYLETDVVLSSAWQPANGTYLCLNGHVVTTTSGRVITINSDVTFTLTDCDTTTTHKFAVGTNGRWTLDEENGTKIVHGGAIVGGNGGKLGSYTIVGGGVYVGGTLYMNGGNICGSSVGRSGYGGGVYVDVNAQVVMNGGTICGNNGGYGGGGVYVASGTFVMEDGSICENGSANSDGGGIYVGGTGVCTINGGEISNNTAGFGGGGISVTDTSTCTVNGGVIAGNHARFGGGLYAYALITINDGDICGNKAECGGAVFVYKTLQLNGGSITRNIATDSGGGIHMQSTGTMVINGGEITGNTAGANGQGGGMYSSGYLTISGSPIIRDNVVGGAIENGQLIGGTTNNLFLFYGSRLNAFDVDGELGAETSIGISAEKTGIFARALGGASLAPYATYFFPDDESYIITTEDDDLRLSKMYRVSFEKNNAYCAGTMDSLEVLDGTVIDLSYCNFTSNGYQFIGWSYTPGTFNQVTIIEQSSIVVNENITLYAVWAPLPLTGTVYIQGELQYGQTITAIVNNTNNTGTLGYYWIGGGTGTHSEDNTYVIQAKDIGSEITCIVYSTEQSGEIVGETNAVVRGKDFGATDIVVNGYYGVYDGQSHQILVSAPEGSIVTYSTRKYGAYSTECPGYKDVGTYTVYYEVFKENYELVRGSALIRIERKSVWINGTQVESTKVYDGTTAAEITEVGQLSVDYYDDVTIVAGTANYSDKNVGQGKTVTFTDFALGGEDAGNYILAAQPRSVTADITPRELHVTAQVADKQYDGLDTAKFVGAPVPADLLSGDQVTLHCGTPVFSRVMVGEAVPIQVDDFTISGPDAINYTVVQPNLTAKIYNAYVPEVGVDYTVNSNDWLNTAFVVTAQEGYKVSRTNTANGDWVNTLEENEETNDGRIIFYVKRVSDGAISLAVTEHYKIDMTVPAIEGITDGATYYTTQTVTITDENLASVTVNGELAETTFQLTNDVEQTYIIVATDEAGNQTTITVIMKPVEDVSADIADITTQDVTSEDVQKIQDVIDHIEELLEQEDLTSEDREALEEQKQAAEDLLAQVEAAQEAVQTEAVEQAREILQGEPDQDDKEVLEQAKEDLEEALENYGGNYTEEEKEEILDLIAQIDEALEELKPCDGGENCPSAPYTDLDSTEWYHTYVDYVIEHGLMTGTSATTFKPYDTINRASMVTILYRISGEQNTATPEEKAQWIDHLRANMTDVIQDYWYEEPIAWAYYKGVTSGTSATTFAPEGVITREQFVLFLYKFSNYLNKETEERADLTSYPDYQSVSDWAVNGVSWGVATGLLTGKGQPDGTSLLAPQGEASRAEAATLIARFHQR